MNYNLISLNTQKLNKDKVIQICKLKDSQWSFGIKSQLEWFKNNIKKMIYITCYILNLNL